MWFRDLFVVRDDLSSSSLPSSAKKVATNRFEFLDGYRGSLAFIVALAHAKGSIDCKFLVAVSNLTQRYCIAGFFLLSAFLLTYKLIKDLEKYESTNSSIPILQYFIRRFFRIYVVFALFTWTVIYGSEFIAGYTYGKYEDIVQVLLLGYPGPNHLWTIAPEIKFYFIIPFICLTFSLATKRYSPLVLAALLAWTLYDQVFNFFQLKTEEIFSYSKQTHLLKNHFAVFLIGSELAMSLHLIEKSESIRAWTKQDRVQKAMNYSSLILAIFGLIYYNDSLNKSFDFSYRSRPAILWSIVLLMCFLAETSSANWIVRFFEKFIFLRSCGKFSFGIYLLHPAAIQFVNSFRYVVKLHLAVLSSLFVAFLFGLILYHVLEKHLIRLGNYLCAKLAKFMSGID